ncbi:hypothetical protein DICPUDRAFT_152813 [Dictyostelium purpureum]|uniref:Uncharacterized protein n=1 Tax=Dictyostelium purpureum TaxID=5786 RepID=F0ZMC0_DICPU|nr:uncharacterized protein DICPUDRAFT_152813 [Dictyostelium purpureum]EGC34933.1 hypothetical protein DICPUDRAFT_152813 [Dictyostelium purpureum]|eukprot:XP_003288566.1 hypothetical protein DICPUDRAFT_152813 [Dictyostelium purpureum]
MNNELNIIINICKLIESSFGINGKSKLISQVFDYDDNDQENQINTNTNNNNNLNNDNKTILSTQKLILTNGNIDGLKILASFNNNSVYYKILLEHSNLIYRQYGSGVSQFIILFGSLLRESIKLTKKGFTINEILDEYKECRLFLKKYQFTSSAITENEKQHVQINYNIKDNFINHYLESIIKASVSKNLLNNYIKEITKIIKSLLNKLPTLDPDKIKILLLVNDDEDDEREEDEQDFSFQLFDGILFESTFSFAGKDHLVKYIDNPKILLLNHEIELKHQKEFSKIEIGASKEDQDIGQLYLKYIESEKQLLFDQLNNIYSNEVNLILNKKIIGDLATQEFVKKSIGKEEGSQYRIQCNGLIKDELFDEILNSTGGMVQSSLTSLSKNTKFYGACKRYRQINIGKKSFELLEGLDGSTQTIILKGSSKQSLKQFKQGLLSLIKSIRSIIINDNYNVVGGCGNFELKIIKLLELKINNITNSNDNNDNTSSNNIKKIILIKSLIKSISSIIKLLIANSNLDLELFDQLLEFSDQHNSAIDIENNSVGSILELKLFESNSMKFSILNSSIELLSIFLKSI